jgi:two-component system OmpR family response regulator
MPGAFPAPTQPIPRLGHQTGAMTHVLVVDDEESLRDLLDTSLRFEGFEVTTASTGSDALRRVAERPPDLVVLDVMLPDLDGFEVSRRLRADGHRVPVIFLTARDTPEDRVRGLTIGGDDYLGKPFSLAELVARIRVVLRRTGGDGEDQHERLAVGDLVIDLATIEVRRGEDPITLTPTEFKLLAYLAENAGRVLSKAQIVDHVWEYDFGGDPNIVETYVSYLRRKVDREREPMIQTVRGFGYRLVPAGP